MWRFLSKVQFQGVAYKSVAYKKKRVIYYWVNFHVNCVKNVQIRSFFWSVFSRIRTEYRPDKTPYLDNFYAVVKFWWYKLLKLEWFWKQYIAPELLLENIKKKE